MRFYTGFSFKLKWRHLKWLAIPIFALLSYFSGAFGFIETYAYTNTDTAWIIDNNDQKQRLQNTVCGNETAYDVIKDFIENFDVDNAFANVEIYLTLQSGGVQTANNISFYVWPKTYPMRSQFWAVGRPNYGTIHFTTEHYYETFTSGQYFYYIEIKAGNCSANSSNITSANGWQSFLTFVNTGVLNSSQSTATVSSFNKHSAGAYSPYWNDTTAVVNGSNLGVDVEENSFHIPYNWIYYTSRPFILGFPSTCINNSNIYCKNVILNGVEYTSGDTIPDTYTLDEGGNNNNNDDEGGNGYFIGSKNSLGTIYTNFEPSNINNFNLDVSFNTNINYINGYDYYQNIDFTNINCYGRVNHNDNYYSYEKFSSCTFELNTENFIVSSDSDLVDFSIENLEIFNSNDIKITDFSSYDKIFIYLDFQYDDDSLNTYVSNLQFNSSMNMLYLDYLKGEIFDDFDLPSYFKLFISNTGFSNDMSSNVSVRSRNSSLSSNNFLYSQPYSTTTLEPTQVYGFVSTYFQNLAVNNSQNLGYMIYHQINNLNINFTPHIDMVFMRDIILSFRNISSNDFYYADDTGTITNNNITVDYSYGAEQGFGDITGLLPPGPLDSLLNIPFKYLSKTINSLNETCSPLSVPFVFDSELTFPCFDTYYEEFPSSLKIFTEVVPCAFILIFYFKHLYKKVSRATSLETTENDEWGCL